MKYKFLFACLLFLFIAAKGSAQVTISSSDSVNCTNACTMLTAHVIGDYPYDPGLSLDDSWSATTIPIGFTFNFYGINYTSCLIGDNGNVTFDTTDDLDGYDDYVIDGPLLGSDQLNTINGPWCDIYLPEGGTITYSTDGVAPNRKFVVTFCSCAMYISFYCPGQTLSTQIIIYEGTNIIETHIAHKAICTAWNGGYAIIGVQNAYGTLATTAPGRDYPNVYACTDEAWRFNPVDTGTGVFYTVASIGYAPVPYAIDSENVYWYNATTGSYLGSGISMSVCPTGPTLYKAGKLGCADTSYGYYYIGSNPFTITAAPTNPSICGAANGSIVLSGMVPNEADTINYLYNGAPQVVYQTASAAGTLTLTGLLSGAYTNIVVNQTGCTSSPVSTALDNPPIAISSVNTSDPTVCGATNGYLTINGLYPSTSFVVTYDLNGVAQTPLVAYSTGTGSITIPNLGSGAYTNIIAAITTSADSCVTPAMGPYYLNNPAIAISGVTTSNPTTCGNNDGYLVLGGLYPGTLFNITYLQNGVPQGPLSIVSNAAGNLTIPTLVAGVYSNISAAIASSPDSCITPPMGPYTLVAPLPPPVFITDTTHPTQCGYRDGTITILALPPYTTDTINYLFNSVPQTSFITITNADSSIFLSGLAAGTYSGFTVTIAQCVYTVTGVAPLGSPTITASFDTTVHLGCHGDTVFFSNYSSAYYAGSAITPGPLYYIWSFGDGTSDTSADPFHVYATQGSYTVSLIADNHACLDTLSLPVTLSHPLFDSFTASTYIICQDSLIQFTNNSFGTPGQPVYYNWYFGDGSTDTNTNTAHSFSLSGTYNVQLIAHDYVPCYDTFSAIIQADTLSGNIIQATDTVICQGTYITFTGLYSNLGNTGNTWFLGDGDSIKNVNPVSYAYGAAGNFVVTSIAYYRACQDVTTTRNITVEPQPLINLGPDTSICEGSGTITLIDSINAGNPAATWLWSTGETTPAINVNTHGVYYATVNIHNCFASDSVIVLNDCYMDIPNAFTPNKDGVNDYFYPRQFLTKGLTSFKMDIYNRWGQLIFETTTLDGSGWDGRFNNTDQPEGVYVYIIDGTFKDGQKEHHQGNITLLR